MSRRDSSFVAARWTALRNMLAYVRVWIRTRGPSLATSVAAHSLVLPLAALLMTTTAAPKHDEAPELTALLDTTTPEAVLEHLELTPPPDASELPTDIITDAPAIDIESALSAQDLDAMQAASVEPPGSTNDALGALGGFDIKAMGQGVKSTGEGGNGPFGRDSGAGGGGMGTLFGTKALRSIGKGGGNDGGLVGRFFDLKQDPARKPLPYSGSFEEYIAKINRLVAGGFSESVTREFYQANTQMLFSQLLIPQTSANDAPLAFNVDKEVEPRGWFVHYSGKVIPPKKGGWRFVGFFDDMLLVYINGQPVLDGSWVPMCNMGQGKYDSELRQDFGGPGVISGRKAYFGKWVNLPGPVKIDILIGETPGGLVGGLLMCQQQGEHYRVRADGTPILPLFATSKAASRRISQDPFAQAYQLVPNPPIWVPTKKKK